MSREPDEEGAPGAASAAVRRGLDAARRLCAAWREEGAAPRRLEAPALQRTEGARLAPLEPDARLVALSLVGPTRDAGGPVAPEHLAVWEELGQRLLVRNRPGSTNGDALWRRIRRETNRRPLAAAAAAYDLVRLDRIPLAVSEPGDLLALPEGRPREVALLGLARTARTGHRTGEALIRRTLADARRDAHLTSAIIKGAGDGLADAGLRWIADRAARALSHRHEWLQAAEAAAGWALERQLEQLEDLCLPLLASAEDADQGMNLLDRLAAVTPEGRAGLEPLLQRLAERWYEIGPGVRALLLHRLDPDALARGRPWLEDASPEVLLAGLELLPEPPDRELLEALRPLAEHPDPSVARRVTQRLLRDPPSRVPPPETDEKREGARVVELSALQLARRPLDRLRVAVASGETTELADLAARLPESDHEEARRALRAGLRAGSPALRLAAVHALAHVGTEADAEALLEAGRAHRGLERACAETLAALGADDRTDALAALYERRLLWAHDQTVDAFVALAGDAALPHLLEGLRRRFFPPARAGAARALARHDFRRAVFALRTRALVDPNRDVRVEARTAVAQLAGSTPSTGEIAGYAPLVVPIGELDEAVTQARRAGAESLPGLRTTLAQGSWRRREAACGALAEIEAPDAEEELVRALTDVDEDVRQAAKLGLDRRGWQPRTPRERTLGAMAERRFEPLLGRPDQVDPDTLEQGLRLGGHVFRSDVLTVLEALEPLRRWEPRPELAARLRSARLDAEGALDEPDGLNALLEAIDRTWQLHPHRATLGRALRRIAPGRLDEALATQDLEWRAREAVCHALGRPGDDEAVAPLARHILDPDEDVRQSAVEALVRIGTTAASRALAHGSESPFQEDADAIAEGLAAVGEAARPALREAAAAPWWETRRVAALALARWRGDRRVAVDCALLLAGDGEERVAEAGREALRMHGVRPSAEAVREVLAEAPVGNLAPVDPWLDRDADGRLRDPEAERILEEAVRELPPDDRALRLGLASDFRVEALIPELEAEAEGEASHAGIRLRAAEILRLLRRPTCRSCHGDGTVPCIACLAAGGRTCTSCAGRGTIRRSCSEPDCTAHRTTRRIDQPPCATCGGTGRVTEPCECGSGRVRCTLCDGTGHVRCVRCEGRGELHRSAGDEPPQASG